MLPLWARGGEMLGVEIKVALADLRGDGKWPRLSGLLRLVLFRHSARFPAQKNMSPPKNRA